jgi:OOP family OmpA-OmpF porin
MKRSLLLLLLPGLIATQDLRAQLRLGLLGGIHSANIIETNQIPGWDTTTKKYQSSHSGVQIGVIAEMPIGRKGLFFQPAIVYTARGRNFLKPNDSSVYNHIDTIYSKSTLSLGYIDIPLNLTLKLPLSRNHKNNFFISAGPYISFFYSGTQTNENLNTTDPPADTIFSFSNSSHHLSVGKGPNTYKVVDFGINARAGFELGNLMLSAYFSRGLSNFYTATYPGTFHQTLLGASVGIWLGPKPDLPAARVHDTDKDGIPDKEDLCPTQPGTAKWHGCPVPDTDHDGIDDDHDSCRTVAGLARYNGCPIPDTDHDGVDDEHDSCKTIPGLPRYNGCPIPDTDHDGIDDEHDSCRTVPGLARYNGCPIPDKDGDGINDEEDKCPDEPGTAENQGCPVVKKEIAEKIDYTAKNILFTLGSDHLFESSHAGLNDLAVLLLAHPEWHLTIEGHTDNSGTAQKNLTLSQKRADAVKTWLVRKGVDQGRLTAIGYGQVQPIAENSTAKGKTANRRVELKVSLEKH